jgi:peptidoglycan hydrolase-like protein with peptidoglycan-binding domain
LPTTTAANKPQDPRRAELSQAIASAVNVPTIPLGQAASSDPQGLHLDSGGYAAVAQKVLSVQPAKAVPQQGGLPTADQPAKNSGVFNINVPEVSVGWKGADVMDVQKALAALGYDLGPKGTDGIRGKFTIAAIKKYQADRKLKVDGDAGPETVTALNKDITANPDKFKSVTKSNPSDVKRVDSKAREIDTKAIQDPEFNSKLDKVAKALGIESDILRRIIKFETAGTFSPTSQDPSGVSIGLIGFTRPTARALGTSREELAKMTAVQQLDYVYKFYKMNGLRPGSDIGTMYMLTFMPAYAYSPENTVLGQKNGGTLGNTGLSLHKIWLQNPAFAKSKGKDFFTVGDVKNMINSRR